MYTTTIFSGFNFQLQTQYNHFLLFSIIMRSNHSSGGPPPPPIKKKNRQAVTTSPAAGAGFNFATNSRLHNSKKSSAGIEGPCANL